MSNIMKQKEYDEIKNKKVDLYVYEKDGKRSHSQCGFNYKEVLEKMMYQFSIGRRCIVTPHQQISAADYRQNYYETMMEAVKEKGRLREFMDL